MLLDDIKNMPRKMNNLVKGSLFLSEHPKQAMSNGKLQ